MKVYPPKIMGCILLVTKTLVWWHELIKGLFSRPLAVLHVFEPIRKQIAPKAQNVWDEAGCFSIHTMAHIYSPRDEKIDFVRGLELKSVMEMDQHSRNLGNGSWKHNEFRLIASHNYRYRGIDTKGLH